MLLMETDKHRHVRIGPVAIGNDLPVVFLCGPCQIESRAHALETVSALAEMACATGVPLIYKSSFDKANRTSVRGDLAPADGRVSGGLGKAVSRHARCQRLLIY